MKDKIGKPDYSLLAVVLFLTVFGLITLYSTNYLLQHWVFCLCIWCQDWTTIC